MVELFLRGLTLDVGCGVFVYHTVVKVFEVSGGVQVPIPYHFTFGEDGIVLVLLEGRRVEINGLQSWVHEDLKKDQIEYDYMQLNTSKEV